MLLSEMTFNTLWSRWLNLCAHVPMSLTLSMAACELERQVTLKLSPCFYKTYTQHDVGHSRFQLSFSSQVQWSKYTVCWCFASQIIKILWNWKIKCVCVFGQYI